MQLQSSRNGSRTISRSSIRCGSLNELCNTDKHRLLLVVALAYDQVCLVVDGDPHVIQVTKPVLLVPGRSLGTLALGSGERPEHVSFGMAPSPQLTFGSREPCGGRLVTEVLPELESAVEAVKNDLTPCVTT